MHFSYLRLLAPVWRKQTKKNIYKNSKMRSNNDKTLALWIIKSSGSNMLISTLNLSTDWQGVLLCGLQTALRLRTFASVLKGAFTRVPQVDQRGWINQSEPCKQFLSTEVINRVDRWTSWRSPTFVQRRWFTLGDSPQITRLCLVSLCMVLLLIIFR